MKKSAIALSAAALVAGLGFAGAANAVWVSTDGVTNTGTGALATMPQPVEEAGVGHILFTPYYSVANGNSTLLSLVNTDTVNGKAVKVRFRGAGNSDDVLDFTVMLSPGDVWTAGVSRGADGLARIQSNDTTCVLPRNFPAAGVDFRTFRLDTNLSDAALAAHTQEGYVEYLNMADIPPGTEVYRAIKHVNGVAPCTSSVMNTLTSNEGMTQAAAAAFGLVNPTGGLFGDWIVVNGSNTTSYAGTHRAVRYTDAAGVTGAGRLFFAPQYDRADPPPAGVDYPIVWAQETADPLLGGAAPAVTPMALDLPDLSTPYVSANVALALQGPVTQAANLSQQLAAVAVHNQFSHLTGGATNTSTDWVFSQPTRRYNIALDYATTGNAGVLVTPNNPYYAFTAAAPVRKNVDLRTLTVGGVSLGRFLCLRAGVNGYDREEGNTAGDYSPVQTSPLCGEVAVLTFNQADSVLQAQLTAQRVNVRNADGSLVPEGWATVSINSATDNAAGRPAGVPVVGYSALSSPANGTAGNGNYGGTFGHRFVRP